MSHKQLSSVVRASKYSFEDTTWNLMLHLCEIPDSATTTCPGHRKKTINHREVIIDLVIKEGGGKYV